VPTSDGIATVNPEATRVVGEADDLRSDAGDFMDDDHTRPVAAAEHLTGAFVRGELGVFPSVERRSHPH
jgi:hypothetical protein